MKKLIIIFIFLKSIAIENIIFKKLDQFQRPLSILIINENNNNLSLKILNKYTKQNVILIERPNQITNNKMNILKQNKNLTLCSKYLEVSDLKNLSSCEHFDFIICFNFLKNYKENLYALRSILNLGNNIFFLENNSLEKLLLKINESYIKNSTNIIENKKTLNIYTICKKKIKLEKNFWDSPGNFNSSFKIKSNQNTKKLIKNNKYSEWKPGINLVSFKYLNGIIPNTEKIIFQLNNLKIIGNDCLPHNFIIQGQNLTPIDINDNRISNEKCWPINYTRPYIENFLNMNIKEAKKYYKNTIIELYPQNFNF